MRAQVIPQQTADETHGAMLQALATLKQDIAYAGLRDNHARLSTAS